jgi:hypothetical protein
LNKKLEMVTFNIYLTYKNGRTNQNFASKAPYPLSDLVEYKLCASKTTIKLAYWLVNCPQFNHPTCHQWSFPSHLLRTTFLPLLPPPPQLDQEC